MERYSGPTNRSDITLIRVEGGGHTIPGGKQYLSEKLIGRVCHDFIAEEMIWEFFKKHPKKQEQSF